MASPGTRSTSGPHGGLTKVRRLRKATSPGGNGAGWKGSLGPRAIQYLVAKYPNEAGVPDASVHALRHTFATHQVKKGTKLDVVRQALSPQDLKTTSIYVDLAREVMDKELQENAL